MPNPKEEQKKETLSKHPHWHAYLPKAFPYRYRASPNFASHLANCLSQEIQRAIIDGRRIPELYYGVTGHPMWREEWLDLWLSKGAADWLVTNDLISFDSIDEAIL